MDKTTNSLICSGELLTLEDDRLELKIDRDRAKRLFKLDYDHKFELEIFHTEKITRAFTEIKPFEFLVLETPEENSFILQLRFKESEVASI